MAMNWSASWRNSSSTLSTSPRVTCLRLAMAVPICWTSRADRYLKTSAAASSPSDMMRIAQRLSASLFWLADILFLHPGTQHHGDRTRVLRGHGARRGEVFLVTAHLAGAAFGGLKRSAVLFDFLRFLLEPFLGLGHVVENRAAQTAPQQDCGSDDQDVLQQLDAVLDVSRVLPEARCCRAFFAEEAVDHADRVAAVDRITHGLLHQRVDLLQFFFRQRLRLAVDIAVVHHHGHRQAAQLAYRVFSVADRAVDLIVDGRLVARRALWADLCGSAGLGGTLSLALCRSGAARRKGAFELRAGQGLAVGAKLTRGGVLWQIDRRDRVRRRLIGERAGDAFGWLN